MGVSIDLSGLKVKGNARVMNDVKITGYEDAKIRAENTEIDGNVEFLERLEIGPVLDEVQSNSEIWTPLRRSIAH